MLYHRLQRWPRIEPTLGHCIIFAGHTWRLETKILYFLGLAKLLQWHLIRIWQNRLQHTLSERLYHPVRDYLLVCMQYIGCDIVLTRYKIDHNFNHLIHTVLWCKTGCGKECSCRKTGMVQVGHVPPLNPRKSGQIANKGLMIYYGRYRSQLAILKNPKQNSCSNLLNWRIVSQRGVHNVMKKWSDGIFYKQTNFKNVFSNCQRTILPGWLTLFYMSLFCRIAKFKMAAICTSYYAKNHISLPITMQIVSVIYYNFNCKRRFQTNSCDVYIILVLYICNVNSKYLHR